MIVLLQNNDVQDSTMLDMSVEVSENLINKHNIFTIMLLIFLQREEDEDVIEPKRRRTTRNNNFS